MTESPTLSDLTARSGLEFVRSVFDLEDRPPIISDALGMRLEVADRGRVAFSAEARPAFGNLSGTVHGGLTTTLLDSAMACAVHTTLLAGASYATLALTVSFVRPVPTDGQRLVAEGLVLHHGRSIVTAEGRVLDAAGRLVAHGTSTCMVTPEERAQQS